MFENRLNAGCGRNPIAGAINLDFIEMEGVDVVHNLNVIPYPFADQAFDYVEASDVIEHLNDPIAVVQEFGRILKVGGTLFIRGPSWDEPEILWSDLTHKRAFAHRTFDGFCVGTYDEKHYGHYHGPIKFKMILKEKKNCNMEFTMQRI